MINGMEHYYYQMQLFNLVKASYVKRTFTYLEKSALYLFKVHCLHAMLLYLLLLPFGRWCL